LARNAVVCVEKKVMEGRPILLLFFWYTFSLPKEPLRFLSSLMT